MLLRFGAPCRNRSNRLGTLHGVAVEPAEKLLLRIIVEEPQAEPLVRVRVPFGRVDQADSDQIVISVTPEEMQQLPPHDPEGLRSKRRPGGRRRRGDEPVERVLTGRTKVQCRDGGEVGALASVTVDSRTGDLESFSFPFGMPMTREISVPADQIAEVRDDRLVLKFDMDSLQEYPTLRT
jgi:sporulation protein YlmC with PRC-barrel domain